MSAKRCPTRSQYVPKLAIRHNRAGEMIGLSDLTGNLVLIVPAATRNAIHSRELQQDLQTIVAAVDHYQKKAPA